ncbi:MAG TPA: FkbM family methyltransferase [Planctomycetota bacterium]
MRRPLRSAATALARVFPAPMRALVGLWALAHRLWIAKPRWLLIELANLLNVRAEVVARLTNGMEIHVVANDIVGQAICYSGFFEPETIALYRSVLAERKVFLDVGAQVGQFTLLASRLVGPRGRVVAFEPDPKTHRMLCKSVARNRLSNVMAVHAALADVNAVQTFHLSQAQNIGANSLRPPAQGLDARTSVQVECWRMDDFLRDHGIPKPDLVKIDVEGAELLVLDGARQTLAGPDQPVLIVEFCEVTLAQFGASCEMLAARLEAFGYHLMYAGEPPLRPYAGPHPQGRAINVAAIPAARLHEFTRCAT